jgi:hypothetical protein
MCAIKGFENRRHFLLLMARQFRCLFKYPFFDNGKMQIEAKNPIARS